MGLANWFKTFCSNIQVQNRDTISARYGKVTRRLNTDFWSTASDTLHSLYVGSYGRNTATQGFSDLDMIFELPRGLYGKYNNYISNGQSALLQEVKKSLQETYPTSEIGANGQVIEINFRDFITFEVLPTFRSDDDSYVFPNSNGGGSWGTTNPRPEIQAIRSRNNECNGNLVRLCRMMRAWKSKWNVPLRGLLIDTLAYQFIGNWEHRKKSFFWYDWMCRDFFLFMANQDRDQEFWRAPGSGQAVDGIGLFQSKAKRCYNLSCEAIEHETATPKQEWSARQRWREIFGTSFPS